MRFKTMQAPRRGFSYPQTEKSRQGSSSRSCSEADGNYSPYFELKVEGACCVCVQTGILKLCCWGLSTAMAFAL